MAGKLRGADSGEGKDRGTINPLQQLADLVVELRRLNDNLEVLRGALEKWEPVGEAAKDLRTVIAEFLGYKVTE